MQSGVGSKNNKKNKCSQVRAVKKKKKKIRGKYSKNISHNNENLATIVIWKEGKLHVSWSQGKVVLNG
jgi:hypothetical protein